MPKYLLFTFFFTLFSFAQTRVITGVVKDNTQKPLEMANVLAKPLQEKGNLKFAIADHLGRYRIELDAGVSYQLMVSYIGFVDQSFEVTPETTQKVFDFNLQATGEQLKEIVIKHDFKPIVVKKDTLLYDVKAFANGNERKMKEILEKLPGVEVDKKGNVTVQGKKVTQMLVEGKSFFGGGSKLAVENIPADALDKIEVIDHFNEVGFMKKVSDSDELAMNVKLKKEKKKFVFGDVQGGAEVANDNGFYLAHAGLFYYSTKTNVSFIGDLNNIGQSTFTFDDLIRFGGGFSSFLSGRKSLSNLYEFSKDNTDVAESKSQFSAVNFSHEINPKISLSGYGIFSKIDSKSLSETQNDYLNNQSINFENKTQNNNTTNVLGIGNVKLDYTPNKLEKWYYNAQFQATNNDSFSQLNSFTDTENNQFQTIVQADNTSVKQFIEWHKQINDNHTTTLVINQSYNNTKPQNTWINNQPFLSGILPWEIDNLYRVEQLKKLKNTTIDGLFKHYWILNNFNHIYTNVGTNFESSTFNTSEQQRLSNGGINNFESAGFGNNTTYKLIDFYLGIEYKFKIGKWINKPGLFLHNYQLKVDQHHQNNQLHKVRLQPQWDSEFEFNNSESLKLTYKLENRFPEIKQFADRYTLQAYNLVFKGNALLENELYHSTSLRYSKMNSYRGIMINGNLSYNKKQNTIRNEVQIDGINQFTTPIQTDNPETNTNFFGSVSKKIYRFQLQFNTNLSWFEYIQNLNKVETVNNRNNQKAGFVLKTFYRKWPTVSLGYNKGFSQFYGLTTAKYQTDEISSKLDISFLKSFTFEGSYESLKNTNSNNQTNFYDLANASLRYQKNNSPLTVELMVNNIFDNKIKSSYSFSDYMISENHIYVLPRVVMVTLNYKL